MSTNTELIARLRAGTGGGKHWMTLQTEAADAIEALEAQLKNASVAAIAEAAEVDRLRAEVERLTTLARGQHIELYNARLQLAAAQGQEPVAWGAFHFGGKSDGKLYAQCETKEQIEAYIGQIHQSSDSITLRSAPLYVAAPIPQQPAAGLTVGELAIEEILQLGYSIKDGMLYPPETGIPLQQPAKADLIPQDSLFVCGQMGANVTKVYAQQAQPEPSEKTWCEYVAGMVGCYLGEPVDSDKCKAIAAIIERRLWALPKPVQQAQPERGPITDEYLESLQDKDFRFSHAIKQGGQHE